MTCRPVVFVLAICTLAFVIRVSFTVLYRGSLSTVPAHEIFGADSVEYDQLARSVADGRGYTWPDGTPTSFRAPGFPLFLAALYSFFGQSYVVGYIGLAACGALGSVSTYLFARRTLDEPKGRLAAVLTALYPPDIFACSYFFSEALFAPCLGFGLWLLAEARMSGSWRWAVGAGLMLGYAALTRSFGLLFLPLFASMLILQGRPKASIAYVTGFLSVLVPWVLRNWLVHGHIVLVATNGGSTFYGANNDVVMDRLRDHGNWVSTRRLPGRDVIDAQPDEVLHDKAEWRLGIKWVESHPAEFAYLAPFKVVRFWLPFVSYPSLRAYPVANVLFTTPFLLMMIVGLVYGLGTRQRREKLILAHLTMLANFVMVVIFWGEPRFRDANVPVLMTYVVVGLSWIRDWRFTPSAMSPGTKRLSDLGLASPS